MGGHVCDLSDFSRFVVDMPCGEEDCIVFGRRADIINSNWSICQFEKLKIKREKS